MPFQHSTPARSLHGPPSPRPTQPAWSARSVLRVGPFFTAAGCRQRCAVLVGTWGEPSRLKTETSVVSIAISARNNGNPSATISNRRLSMARVEPSPCVLAPASRQPQFLEGNPVVPRPPLSCKLLSGHEDRAAGTGKVVGQILNGALWARKRRAGSETGPLKRGGSAATVHH